MLCYFSCSFVFFRVRSRLIDRLLYPIMKYKTDDDIRRVIETFEDGTIARDAWGHTEHLIVAYHYSKGETFDSAYERMKNGIFRLLEAFEVDLSKEMPYHETMTVFWLRHIYDYANQNNEDSLVTRTDEMITRYDKDFPLRFYSKDLLFSEMAKAEFVEPDLRPNPEE